MDSQGEKKKWVPHSIAPLARNFLGKYAYHSSQELTESSVEERKADDDVWCGIVSCVNVCERQNHGREREGGETERRWVSKVSETFVGLDGEGSSIGSQNGRECVQTLEIKS